MLDFLTIATRTGKKGVVEIFPKFRIMRSSDLMIRGSDFYAIWIEDRHLWSTDEQDAIELIDKELDIFADKWHSTHEDTEYRIMYLWDSSTGMIDIWHKYCQRHLRDNYHMLDEKLLFANDNPQKTDYASRKLSYPLEEGSITAYDALMSVLYSPEERHKLEWAIGSIITGDSKKIQKFMVLYGAAGTGKSTVLNIMQQLFEGYYSVFDAKALGSASNSFALEAFKTNPLVAIQHDGDLSRIEDNTRLNSLVSHELMTVNEKFKSTYANRFKAFLFMGTNKPVKITDAKSGLMRRLIDVSPSGDKIPVSEYKDLVKQVNFELGAIAWHCRDVYLDNPGMYDDYIPLSMLGASNDFFNFVIDSYYIFAKDDGTTLNAAWTMYKEYCSEANVPYPYSRKNFKEELKNYFREFDERITDENGVRIRSWYSGFRSDKFKQEEPSKKHIRKTSAGMLELDKTVSLFDALYSDAPAQYGNEKGTPNTPWSKVETTLKDIDTHKVHYVRVPENHIVIDFDIPDKNGEKCLEKNLQEAGKWPPTYAELSKSGQGVHLHYIYSGDPKQLSRVYDDKIEIKVFSGKSSLRRKLTLCNDIPIATISSGLPLKEESATVNFNTIKNERALRTLIKKNLNKEIVPNTKPSMELIYKDVESAYNSGMSYDITNMKAAIRAFALSSTHQADACLKLFMKMHFCSKDLEQGVIPEIPTNESKDDKPIIFYDVEVFPNLFLINWKVRGNAQVHRMINPTKDEVTELCNQKLVGFNCRRYDNHILYGRILGYSNKQLYNLSQRIVNGDKDAFFRNAYDISYTDVYDFAATKQSLKKWEIELDIHHQELGLPWDQPVPEEMWEKVAEYCDNDVIATEATFEHLQDDFLAREILAELTGSNLNTTTNTLSAKYVFGKERNPQKEFNWRNLAEPVGADRYEEYREKFGDDYVFRVFDSNGQPTYKTYNPMEPLEPGYSILPFFPGYKYDMGKSTYKDIQPDNPDPELRVLGEGGAVYAQPNMYGLTVTEDVASMHPHSAWAERIFGVKYSKRFYSLVEARVAIKHGDLEEAKKILGPEVGRYLTDPKTAKRLAYALKIVINSVYGQTAASFSNPFRDPNNIDNIVAKRGALFMTNLRHEVAMRGFTVAHIKTDSIKVVEPTPEILDFIVKYGKEFGYTFEVEDVYKKFCLVNKAVYIALNEKGHWEATGAQFAVPYVYKTLFSKEPLEFKDFCETKSTKTALYLCWDDPPRPDSMYEFIGRVGLFCPVKHGAGLYREQDGKYNAVTGTKGYQWLEAETVKKAISDETDLNAILDVIDISYYTKLVDDAVETISQFGDFEWLVAD